MYVDYGTVLIGSNESTYITLYNNSNCSLPYRLSVDQNVTGPYSDEEYKNDLIGKCCYRIL